MSARAGRAGMQRRPHPGASTPCAESWRRGGDHPTLLATHPAADFSLECIGDLARSDLPAWLGAAQEDGLPER